MRRIAIRRTGKTWIARIVAIAIGLWILLRTWSLLRDTTHILLQGVPRNFGLDECVPPLATWMVYMVCMIFTSGQSQATMPALRRVSGSQVDQTRRMFALVPPPCSKCSSASPIRQFKPKRKLVATRQRSTPKPYQARQNLPISAHCLSMC